MNGTDRALANADAWQQSGFIAAVESLPAGWVFAIEDLTENDTFGLVFDHPNRLGAWTRAAAQAGLIERVGYRPARKPSRAGAVVAVWRRCA